MKSILFSVQSVKLQIQKSYTDFKRFTYIALGLHR